MFAIDTVRLNLIPLDFECLALLKRDRILLEKHLNLNFTGHKVSFEVQEEIKKDLNYRIEDVKENPEQFEWFTSWEIILKGQEESIGAIGFTRPPDENGTTSIGFYIDERHRKRGFATEALAAMTNWAFTNSTLLQIEAETLAQNKISQKVLQKNNFIITGFEKEIVNWELKKQE